MIRDVAGRQRNLADRQDNGAVGSPQGRHGGDDVHGRPVAGVADAFPKASLNRARSLAASSLPGFSDSRRVIRIPGRQRAGEELLNRAGG